MQGFCNSFLLMSVFFFFPVFKELERIGKNRKPHYHTKIKPFTTPRTCFTSKIKAKSSLIQLFERFVFRAFHSLNLPKP